MLGQKIKKAIEKSDISAEQVAAFAEMSLTNLYKIYKRDSVETRYLVKIAEVLQLPVQYFLYDVVEEERATYQTQQNGTGNLAIGNAAGKHIKQKIMPQENEGKEGAITDKLRLELELCKNDREHLQKEIALKDEIINLLKEKQQ